MQELQITVLHGDGVGPEVCREAIRVLDAVSAKFDIKVKTRAALIGGVAIREAGSPLPEATIASFEGADAVLLGAVGDPSFDGESPERRPEAGLLQMRQILGGFANLRPSRSYPALAGSSPLRKEIFDGTDLLIVRELLGGLYFGSPRGFHDSGRSAYNTMRYAADEIERVARVAFEAAESRRGKLTSVDKANVLETSQLWRKVVDEISNDYRKVEVDHLFVDACAMHLVTDPRRFDVILTENLFGDILSDAAAVLTGSLGMLPSATIGGRTDLYEPVHGSAPDIAGKDIANPIGAIASAALMLRHTAKHEGSAVAIERAIDRVLDEGYRTRDISAVGAKVLTTTEMGMLIAEYAVEDEQFLAAAWGV